MKSSANPLCYIAGILAVGLTGSCGISLSSQSNSLRPAYVDALENAGFSPSIASADRHQAIDWDALNETTRAEILTIAGVSAARMMCSGVFNSGRSPESVAQIENNPNFRIDAVSRELYALMRYDVDEAERTVAYFLDDYRLGFAVHRHGLGCVSVFDDGDLAALRAQSVSQAPHDPEKPWPFGDSPELASLPPEIDADELRTAVDFAFDTKGLNGAQTLTYGLAVVYEGQLVAERYTEGFDHLTPTLSASASKTLTGAIIARRVHEGGFDLNASGLFGEWLSEGDFNIGADGRAKITPKHLLAMESGLAFNPRWDLLNSDLLRLTFATPNMVHYALRRPLAATPGTRWNYSNGDSQLLMYALQRSFHGDQNAYLNYPYREFFDKLGMSATLFETDTTGVFIGGGYAISTARDYARLGLLYLNDGIWNGERLLPVGWVDYATSPSDLTAPGTEYFAKRNRSYGKGHLHVIDLNGDGVLDLQGGDAYEALGAGGNSLTVVPDRDLIIVRLGWQGGEHSPVWFAHMKQNIIDVFPAKQD